MPLDPGHSAETEGGVRGEREKQHALLSRSRFRVLRLQWAIRFRGPGESLLGFEWPQARIGVDPLSRSVGLGGNVLTEEVHHAPAEVIVAITSHHMTGARYVNELGVRH